VSVLRACTCHETYACLLRFGLVLDARKSGLKVKDEVKARDLRRFGGSLTWRMYKKDEVDDRNNIMVQREASLGPFIVNLLAVPVPRSDR
jgi:hypothetical protein